MPGINMPSVHVHERRTGNALPAGDEPVLHHLNRLPAKPRFRMPASACASGWSSASSSLVIAMACAWWAITCLY